MNYCQLEQLSYIKNQINKTAYHNKTSPSKQKSINQSSINHPFDHQPSTHHNSTSMILKLQHSHPPKPQQPPIQPQPPIPSPPNEHCPPFLKQLLLSSLTSIDKKSSKTIKQSLSHKERKVHSTLLPTTETAVPTYLSVMFEKVNTNNQAYIKSLMGNREESIVDKIIGEEIVVKQQQANDRKIKRIRNQLDQKIKEMKKELGDFPVTRLDASHSDVKMEGSLGNNSSRIDNSRSLAIIEDFKKKQYWKDQSFSEQNKRIKSFLSKMKRQKSELESKYNQDLELRFSNLTSTEQAEKQKLSQQKQQLYLQNLQKQYKQKSLKRKEYFQTKQHKIKQIQNFLTNVNGKEPIHLRYQKDFKDFLAKQEQNKQKILKEIKEKHPNYSPQEVQEHMNKYVQIKEKYNEEKEMKAVMQQEILSKRYQQLQDLYHSKHHKSITDHKKSLDIVHQSLTKNREKIKLYANTVKDSFKPQIDKRKKEQLLNNVKLLELSQDPTMKKVVRQNGVIQFEQKPQNDAYEKGVSYLQQLRSLNEQNKSRLKNSTSRYQQRSNSALQLTSPKKIDYLRESRPSLDLKPTISDWKDLLQKKDFTQRDKLQRVMDRAQSLQIHAKQKEVQLRNMKRHSQEVMSVKEESDRYYLESIAARMVMLKDVVMK